MGAKVTTSQCIKLIFYYSSIYWVGFGAFSCWQYLITSNPIPHTPLLPLELAVWLLRFATN